MKKKKNEYLPRLSKSKDFQKNYTECCQIEDIINKRLKNKHDKRIGNFAFYSTLCFLAILVFVLLGIIPLPPNVVSVTATIVTTLLNLSQFVPKKNSS